MNIWPVTSDALRRLAGLSIGDELRRELRQAETSILRNLRCLTNARSSLYGQPFWMVTAAEALAKAETVAENRRARLTHLGEPHGRPVTEGDLPWS